MSDDMGREFVYLPSHATNRFFIPNWGDIYKLFSDNTCSSLLIFIKINKYPQKNMRNDSMFCWGLSPNRSLGLTWYFHQNLVITSTTILSRSEGRATPLLR